MEKNYRKHCISKDATILEALRQLNDLSGDALTLFVIDHDDRVVGTLTDGDLRRGLINKSDLNAKVDSIMNRNFSFLRAQCNDCTDDMLRIREKRITLVPILDEEMRLAGIIDLNKTRSLLPIDAVLMAGGKGERLRPLTETMPKPLLPVGDKTIIDHNISQLLSYGIDNIYVTVNYLKECIIDHFSATPAVRCVEEPAFMGTLGSVRLIDDFKHDTVLVMNSDLFTDINYEDFYLHFRMHDADMSIAAVPYSVAVPYGIMDLEGRNLKGIIEKPTYNYYANGGIYLIKRELLELIPKNQFFNATDLIDTLIAIGKNVIRFPINGTWIDIGNPQEYQKACDLAHHLKR